MKNPTNPESAAESSASSTHHMDATLMPPSNQISNQLMAAAASTLPSAAMISGYGGVGESNYEVFDPLNWMLDGLVDFPYSYNAVQVSSTPTTSKHHVREGERLTVSPPSIFS